MQAIDTAWRVLQAQISTDPRIEPTAPKAAEARLVFGKRVAGREQADAEGKPALRSDSLAAVTPVQVTDDQAGPSPEMSGLFEQQRIEAEREIRAFAARYEGEWRDSAEAYVRHLTTGDPDVWHGAVTGWNTDAGYAPIRWVMRQPDCDRATARFLFFLLDVYGFADQFGRTDLPQHQSLAVEIARELWDRIQGGFYRRSGLEFTPQPYLPAWVIEKVRAMSPEQLEPIAGRKVTPWNMERDRLGNYAWE